MTAPGRSPIVLLVAALLGPSVAWAERPALSIETIAGSGRPGDAGSEVGSALELAVDQPFGVEVGPDGALYITSVGAHRVLRLDLNSRKLASVAGSGKPGYAGDGGQATAALLNEPYEVRFDDAAHYMYFVEMKNNLVRRIDLHTGVIATVAGRPQGGITADGGPADEALFSQPHSIALDNRGGLYVADIGNHRIRKIDLATLAVTSIAGTGEKKLPVDGSMAAGRPILGPRALHIVGRTLWIALREGNSVWRMDLDSGVIRHVAGTGRTGYSGDGGPPRLATFAGPKGIVATADGLVYVVDTENQAIRLIDTAADRIYTVAGMGPRHRGFAGEIGPALAAKFDRPHGIGLSPDGTLYVGDTNNHRVRRLRP